MPIHQVTPLAPVFVLLLGAALILIIGPALTPRRRHGLVIAISALAVLSLFLAARGEPAASSGNGLAEWLGESAFALRIVLLEPYQWILVMLLLAISLAERDTADQLSPLDQAMLFALSNVCLKASGVEMSGFGAPFFTTTAMP